MLIFSKFLVINCLQNEGIHKEYVLSFLYSADVF